MSVPGVKYFGPGRRRGLPDKRHGPHRERRHTMGTHKATTDTNGGARVTLSLQTIIQTAVLASLLGAAGYATTKLSTIPSPDKIEKIEARITDLDRAREQINMRILNMEKDVARQSLDIQDIKNSMREIERLMRRQAEGRNGR